MRWPGVVEQEILQESVGFLSGQGLVGLVGRQLFLNGLEQGSVDDRGLLSGQDLTPVFDLANKEPVPEEVGEGSSSERYASAGLAAAEGPRLGADVFGSEVPDKFVDAGDLKISAEDHPDPIGLLLDDGELAVLQLIPEGEGTPHPQSFSLGGSNLVADTLGGNLPLELGKGQEHVQGEPTHGRRCVELLGDRDEGDVMGIEQFDQFCEVGQRSGEAIDLVDADDIDLAGSDICQKPLQVRTVG